MSVSTDHRQSNMVFNTDRGKSHSDIVIYDRVRTVYSIPIAMFIKTDSITVQLTVTTSSDISPPFISFCRLVQETQQCIASTIEINLQ